MSTRGTNLRPKSGAFTGLLFPQSHGLVTTSFLRVNALGRIKLQAALKSGVVIKRLSRMTPTTTTSLSEYQRITDRLRDIVAKITCAWKTTRTKIAISQRYAGVVVQPGRSNLDWLFPVTSLQCNSLDYLLKAERCFVLPVVLH